MMILPDGVMKDRYDVIVVGAGLGGMTAASLLAKRGLSVLMIDQQNKPGGSCTSFKREDHVFDVGTAMIYGFGEKGFRPFRFIINELEEPIDVVAHKTLARMTFEGHEIIFWPDIDRFLEELFLLFPEEKEGLRAFYTDLRKMYENIVVKNEVITPPSEFSPRQGLRRLISDPFSIIRMQKLLSTSTMDLLKKYFHTPEIFNFFDKLCSAYAYTTAEETPAVLVATMFIDNHWVGSTFRRAVRKCCRIRSKKPSSVMAGTCYTSNSSMKFSFKMVKPMGFVCKMGPRYMPVESWLMRRYGTSMESWSIRSILPRSG